MFSGQYWTTYESASVSSTVYLKAGQTVSLYMYANSDYYYNVMRESHMSVVRLRDVTEGFFVTKSGTQHIYHDGYHPISSWRIAYPEYNFNLGNKFNLASGAYLVQESGAYICRTSIRMDRLTGSSSSTGSLRYVTMVGE